jgi:hypothetical protein
MHKPMMVPSEDVGSQEGVIAASLIACELRCAYMYTHIFLDNNMF